LTKYKKKNQKKEIGKGGRRVLFKGGGKIRKSKRKNW